MARPLSIWTQCRRALDRHVVVTCGSVATHGRLICVNRKEITVENRLGIKRRIPMSRIDRISTVRDEYVNQGRNQ